MSQHEPSKEELILRTVKQALTGVIKDTATQPGMIHPLSEGTIDQLRNCLMLISEREKELTEDAGRPMSQRPHFTDERKASHGCRHSDRLDRQARQENQHRQLKRRAVEGMFPHHPFSAFAARISGHSVPSQPLPTPPLKPRPVVPISEQSPRNRPHLTFSATEYPLGRFPNEKHQVG